MVRCLLALAAWSFLLMVFLLASYGNDTKWAIVFLVISFIVFLLTWFVLRLSYKYQGSVEMETCDVDDEKRRVL